MERILQEATAFFKSEQAYDKLFQLFKKKYESLGRIGGTVPTDSFSMNELQEISKFFGVASKDLAKKGKISLLTFEQQLAYTRFEHISLKQLLDAYFGETIISKKELELREAKQLKHFFQEQQHQFPHISFWLTWLFENRRESRWLIQMAEETPAEFVNLLQILQRGFTTLPEKAERLPLFSQRITGDPHAFDLHTSLGKAFIHLLTVHFYQPQEVLEIPRDTEAINELLQQYHIYRDDLLNFVTCCNLIAETKQGIHPVWEQAARHQTVQIIPLREIIPLISIYPKDGQTVWVVENSGVCATLLDHAPNTPMICTNGQFTLATLLLMDRLVENNITLYYASDFDPEGLGMAERLLDRYSTAINLWRMDSDHYKMSNPQVVLSDSRLEKLTHLTNEPLLAIADEMRLRKKAGYQEALIDLMITDIQT